MSNLADLCRECELPSKTRELEEAIEKLIIAGDNLCKDCQQIFNGRECADCLWFLTKEIEVVILTEKNMALKLREKEESE